MADTTKHSPGDESFRIALLAAEQLEGRLAVSPRIVISQSAQLTEDMRQGVTSAWHTVHARGAW